MTPTSKDSHWRLLLSESPSVTYSRYRGRGYLRKRHLFAAVGVNNERGRGMSDWHRGGNDEEFKKIHLTTNLVTFSCASRSKAWLPVTTGGATSLLCVKMGGKGKIFSITKFLYLVIVGPGLFGSSGCCPVCEPRQVEDWASLRTGWIWNLSCRTTDTDPRFSVMNIGHW